jgi:hypothetical protein
MSSRVMYVRDSSWNPIGAIVISAEHNKQRAEYQLSMRNPEDAIDPSTGRKRAFDRRHARLLAMERLVDDPITVRLPKNANQHDISMAVMKDIATSRTAPSRAVKFAKMWVREVSLWFLGASDE